MARLHNKQATLSTLMVPSALALCICVKDKQNIDLSQFSKRGYIMPGDYTFTIKVNQNQLEEQPVSVLADENDKSQSRVCFTSDQVKKFGFKEKYFTQLKTWHNGQCVDVTALNGVEATPDLGSGTLTLNVPQAYLEYTSDDWVPPAMWDNGIPGLIADYNVNAQTRHNEGSQGGEDKSVSGNGTVGANVGPWGGRAPGAANQHAKNGKAPTPQKNASNYVCKHTPPRTDADNQ